MRCPWHLPRPGRSMWLQLALALGVCTLPYGVALAQSAPQRGGTLVVGIEQLPGHLNPAITTDGAVHAVADSIFSGLVRLDDRAAPLPDLAIRWEVSPDARTYTFHLREGVLWHDGAPFTAADVKFTFEHALLLYHARTRGGLEALLDAIDTPDEHTVVFRFRQPYAALLQRLDVTEAPILPQHVYARVPDLQQAPENLHPVGTGPFRFVDYVPDDMVVLERFAGYFQPELPYLDRLVFRAIPDANTRLLALERGEIDVVTGVPGSELERLASDPELGVQTTNSGPGGGFCVMTLAFNLQRSRFQDVQVRQALAHAVDRGQLLEQVLFGNGQVATGPISSQLASAYSDDVPIAAYDPELSETLLDQAGYPRGADGVRFEATFLHFPTFAKYGEVLRQQFARVGVRLELVALDRSAFVTRVFERRDFDTAIISYCNNTDPSIGVARTVVSSNIGNVPFSNAAAYANPEIDLLFGQAAEQADPTARAALYRRAQQILVADAPYLWLVETRMATAYRAQVRGLEPWRGALAERAWLAR